VAPESKLPCSDIPLLKSDLCQLKPIHCPAQKSITELTPVPVEYTPLSYWKTHLLKSALCQLNTIHCPAQKSLNELTPVPVEYIPLSYWKTHLLKSVLCQLNTIHCPAQKSLTELTPVPVEYNPLSYWKTSNEVCPVPFEYNPLPCSKVRYWTHPSASWIQSIIVLKDTYTEVYPVPVEYNPLPCSKAPNLNSAQRQLNTIHYHTERYLYWSLPCASWTLHMLTSLLFKIHRTVSLPPTTANPKLSHLFSSLDQNRVSIITLRRGCSICNSFSTSAAGYSVSFWVRRLNSSKWSNTA
jgi:hypothetical protein